MRDIEAATGENLGSDRVSKKGKGKKKKYPNLSDLNQSSSTSRSRLEKKVFNKYIACFYIYYNSLNALWVRFEQVSLQTEKLLCFCI